jgi:hypothetical protein
MNRSCQLSERTKPDRILSVVKASYCALGKSGLTRRRFVEDCFASADFFQILRIDYFLVLAKRLMRWVQR